MSVVFNCAGVDYSMALLNVALIYLPESYEPTWLVIVFAVTLRHVKASSIMISNGDQSGFGIFHWVK